MDKTKMRIFSDSQCILHYTIQYNTKTQSNLFVILRHHLPMLSQSLRVLLDATHTSQHTEHSQTHIQRLLVEPLYSCSEVFMVPIKWCNQNSGLFQYRFHDLFYESKIKM